MNKTNKTLPASSRATFGGKQNTISCRVRNHTNFLGVINRATVRLALKNHSRSGSGHLIGENSVRCTCLDSGSPDPGSSAQLNRHRQKAEKLVYQK